MERQLSYLIVDDDAIHNRLCTIAIKQFNTRAEVTSMTDPVAALAHIQERYAQSGDTNTILLLDLNMPVMNGWEFLEHMSGYDESIRSQLDVYILTSSIDGRDRDRARNNTLVCGFMEKPLTGYQLDAMALVKKVKDNLTHGREVRTQRTGGYQIGDAEREYLDLMLPRFQLNDILNVQNCMRDLKDRAIGQMRNVPIGMYADAIKGFLIGNNFAYNFSGDPLINKKGMDLKAAGSLHEFEKRELLGG